MPIPIMLLCEIWLKNQAKSGIYARLIANLPNCKPFSSCGLNRYIELHGKGGMLAHTDPEQSADYAFSRVSLSGKLCCCLSFVPVSHHIQSNWMHRLPQCIV